MTEVLCACGKPTGGAWLCQQCQQTLRWALVNVATYYVDLGTVARKETRYGADGGFTKGPVGKDQPLVVDMRFASGPVSVTPEPDGRRRSMPEGGRLRWDAWHTIVMWAGTVMADQRPLTGPACEKCKHMTCAQVRRRVWPDQRSTTSLVAYLCRQFDYVVRSEWAPQLLDEMLHLEKRLKRMVDRNRDRMYLGVCTNVLTAAVILGGLDVCPGSVYALEGDPTGKCDECAKEYDVASSRAGLEAELDAMLMTAADIARSATYLGLNADRERVRKRINQWHTRGVIEAKGQDENGKPRFPYGEVRARLYAEFTDGATRAGA